MQQTCTKEVQNLAPWYELCKKLKFDHSTKCYMYKPESVLENKKHEILWDLKIQNHQLILAKRSNRVN